ncbi:hypothetical protein Ddye_013314 [Dipteronia dyeriana]|uniref:Uncharacterized protein n=1 Tax=Dipteronia dyeriana TaxID=168575 RepID=A0AAE0CK38_9ROSI|nr:hypothetical protein Ddye_013314 [Dipteronia dyeriana]
MIRGLYDDIGLWRTKEEEMGGIISYYFSLLYTSSQPSSDHLDGVFSSVERRLLLNLRNFLDMQFTADEICYAIFLIDPSKMPGSNGFHVDFY